jgi:hypothetical protein
MVKNLTVHKSRFLKGGKVSIWVVQVVQGITNLITDLGTLVSSQGEDKPKSIINIALLLPLTLVLVGRVVKNGSKWILVLVNTRVNPESYDLLSKFVRRFVTVHVVDLGISFTTMLVKRKDGRYVYVNIPSRLKPFFAPAWLEDKPLTVLVTIDPRLLQNNAQRLTNVSA